MISEIPSEKKTPVNDNCAMRRNVKIQPYGRCSICTLKFRQCHAFRSSSLRFAVIILVLSIFLVPTGWPLQVLVLAILASHVFQGSLDHSATNELVDGERKLRVLSKDLADKNRTLEEAHAMLEERVSERTAKLRQSNIALARSNVELMQIGSRQEQMVVDLSHELRTPLASIKGAGQNMLDEIPGPITQDQREYLDIIVQHANRLTVDAQEIIDAARGQRASVKLTLENFNLKELIREVTRGVEPAAKQRNIEIQVEETPVINVSADAPKLRTVVENLLSNALKFTNEGGKITVAVTKEGDGVCVRVADTGVGIETSKLSDIFDRFERGDSTREGSGVGLALSRELARMHGGDIVATSELGRGSEFALSLPGVSA